MKRVCCDGLCQQGRYCCDFQPPPAESVTEVGYTENDLGYPWKTLVTDFILAVALGLLALSLAWWFI